MAPGTEADAQRSNESLARSAPTNLQSAIGNLKFLLSDGVFYLVRRLGAPDIALEATANMDFLHSSGGHGPASSEPPIDPPDSFLISSAQGWMELGNLREAGLELAQVDARWRDHPGFLEIEWELEARKKNWTACLAIAERILRRAPESAFGWIHRSYALHELKRTQEAWDGLRPVVSRFRELWTIPYNLACYSCQLGRLGEAKTWLMRALLLGDAKKISAAAREDPDLAPLREQSG